MGWFEPGDFEGFGSQVFEILARNPLLAERLPLHQAIPRATYRPNRGHSQVELTDTSQANLTGRTGHSAQTT